MIRFVILAIALLVFGSVAQAQDNAFVNNFTIAVQPLAVTIVDGDAKRDDVGGFVHRGNPFLLEGAWRVTETIVVRGRGTLFPAHNGMIEYHTNLSDGDDDVIYAHGAKFTQHVYGATLEWQPLAKAEWLYALINPEYSRYERSAEVATNILVNGRNVMQKSQVSFSHFTLYLGAGIERDFGQFGIKAEAMVAPMLSNLWSTSTTSNDVNGELLRFENQRNTRGFGYGLVGRYQIAKYLGLEASVKEVRVRSITVPFEKDNGINPQTSARRFGFGVVIGR